MDRGLTQEEAADQIGVRRGTIRDWELGYSSPKPRYVPALIEFLGYVPFEINESLPEQLEAHRKLRGLSRSELAARLGVCPGTLWRWEKGKQEPAINHWPAVIDFLGFVPFEVGDSLPERIRAYRKILGLTQNEFARRLGVSESTVEKWERGLHQPSGKNWRQLHRLLSDGRLSVAFH